MNKMILSLIAISFVFFLSGCATKNCQTQQVYKDTRVEYKWAYMMGDVAYIPMIVPAGTTTEIICGGMSNY